MRAHQVIGTFLAAALSVVPTVAGAEASGDVSLFSISKSENRNQVVYAVRVDNACRPVGEAPVHAYWRMLERGPSATEPLLSREERAYGMVSQETAPVAGSGERVVRLRLRAVPDRTIVVHTARIAEACTASATATVAAKPVSLFNVHARLRRLFFGVESLTLSGREAESGAVTQETLQP